MSEPTQIEGLGPVAPGDRVFRLPSYVWMLWATLITVQLFVLGQALLPPNGTLTVIQGVVVILLSGMVGACLMALNGHAGFKYGVPYCIQVRAAFGPRGARFPEALRLLTAIVWYGFGTWIAALSAGGIVQTLTGFSTPYITYVYFLVFLAVQTWLAYYGIRTMKWFNVSSTAALVLILGYILFHILKMNELEIAASLRASGDWGWGFWSGVNATLGIMAAVLVSASDLTRYIERRESTLWWGHILGIAPPLLFMVSVGFVGAVMTGIWNPIKALMMLSPSPVLMVLLLAFVLIAEFTTNLTVNIMPPVFIFEELLGVSWKKGVILTGVLGAFTFPWILLESSGNFLKFINYCTTFFGPLLGCMLADYWLGRGALEVEQLYISDATSDYWHYRGVNWAGVLSTIWVAVLMMWVAPGMSLVIGMPLGFLSYGFLARANRRTTLPVVGGR